MTALELHLRCDTSQWPILYFEGTGPLTDADFKAGFGWILDAIATGAPFAILSYMPPGAAMRADQRKASADFLRAHEAELEGRLIAIAAVTPSPILRGVVTAIMWLVRPRYEFRMFGDRVSAERFLKERISAKTHKAA